MDITIDTAGLSRMLGRMDVYRALLHAMQVQPAANESTQVLKLRLQRALQNGDLTVRLKNAQGRVPAELAFIGRTVAEVHPNPTILRAGPA